jgi:PAS domain S-box-containing protein
MSRFTMLPIRMQLLALAVLLTLPALGIIVYSGVKDRNEHYHAAAIETQKLADNLAARQENIITEGQLLASLLADLPDVHTRNKGKIDAILTKTQQRNVQYQSILIADETGVIWASSLPGMTGISIVERRYFNNARATMHFSSGEVVAHKLLQTPTISLAYPLANSKGEFDGVIILSYNLEVMRSTLHRAQLPPHTNYRLVDHNGVIISSGSDAGLKVGEPLPRDQFRQMLEGGDRVTGTFTRGDGDQRIFTSRKLWLKGETSPFMYIRATISANEVRAASNRALLINISLLLPFVASAFLLALFIAKRSITNKVAVLRSSFQQIANGDFAARIKNRVEGGELGELGYAFDAMAERLTDDIARREQAEEYLHDAMLRLQLATASGQLGVWDWNPEEDFMVWDTRMFELYGISQDSFTATVDSWMNGLHPDDKDRAVAECQDALEGKKAFDTVFRVIHPDGTVVYIKADGIVIRNAEGKAVRMIGINRDITEQKGVEEALKREQVLTNAIFDSIPGLLYLYDDQGKLIRWNKKHETMTGYTAEELAGMSLLDWYRGSEEDIAAITRGVEQCLVEGYAEATGNLQIKDGSKILFHFTAVRLEIDGKTYFAGIGIDITEREKLQNELIKMQKLESLGVLAGGIAHDFNNILTGIMGNISFAKMVLDESHEAFKPLEKAEKASLRAAELAKKLLIFAKGGQPVKRAVTVQSIVKDAVSTALSGSSMKFTMEFPLHFPIVEVDESQLSQAFLNIINNAVEAMPPGGKLTIRGETVALPTENSVGLPAGDYVTIAFTDEGCGISAANLKKIFDPYFSTKAGGSGLGLASAHTIITKHGGQITVESVLEEGTTFAVYLPAATAPAGDEQRGNEDNTDKHGTILVMDDEEMVRDITSLMLEKLGYKVTTCINGDEAISLYHSAMEAGTPFSIVIMDLTIPGGMGGVEAASRIRAFDPDARLVVSSGYSDDPVMANYRDYGFCAAMEKPYKVETIAQVLEECNN